MGTYYASSQDTALGSRETTRSVLNPATAFRAQRASLHHRPTRTKSYYGVTLNHEQQLVRAAISQPIRWHNFVNSWSTTVELFPC